MAEPLEILNKYWSHASFRPLQEEIISSIINGNDGLALLPTGGGKSVCFQVPGLILDGVTIVVTPLIALMKDQVNGLKEKGILAAAIHTGMRKSDIDRTLDNFVYGNYKFLYVSPERLLTELMIERSKRMKINLLVIDEAHCISKWGHDFRPSYLKINKFRSHCKNAPVIALTATATKATELDMLKQLSLKKPKVFRMSFKRSNLSISCLQPAHKNKALANYLNTHKGSSIVYAKSRKQTQEISNFLNSCGLSSDFYHAGLGNDLRFQKQDDWIQNKTQIMVSTNAFGMGIDKADVRNVLHLHIPQNIESYYQEIGRAGRDGQIANVVLFYNQLDIEMLNEQLNQRYPSVDFLSKIYQSLCNYYKLAIGSQPEESFEFDAFDFNSTFGYKTIPVHFALKMLESQEIIGLNEAYQASSVFNFLIENQELFDLQNQNKDLNEFTKTLLRIYGGELFLNPVNISEMEIAKAYHTSKLQIEKLLTRLNQLKIGSYKKQMGKPSISFLNNRFDANKLPLRHKEIKNRKDNDAEAIRSMVSYVESKNRCRMAQLQDYFGEENAENCGICDHCLDEKKEILKKSRIEEIGRQLEKKFPLGLNQISDLDKGNFEEVIHHFIDNRKWNLKEGKLDLN